MKIDIGINGSTSYLFDSDRLQIQVDIHIHYLLCNSLHSNIQDRNKILSWKKKQTKFENPVQKRKVYLSLAEDATEKVEGRLLLFQERREIQLIQA